MKATELRIVDAKEFRCGNYIYVEYYGDMILPKTSDRLEKVNAYHIKDLYQGELDWHYIAIPLTEEWLLKFGFYWDNKEEMYIDGFYRLTYTNKSKSEWYFNDFGLDLKYVHQLQNLYYSLTGQELVLASE